MVDQLTSRFLKHQLWHPTPPSWDKDVHEGFDQSHTDPWYQLDEKQGHVIVHRTYDYQGWATALRSYLGWQEHVAMLRGEARNATETMRQRLSNANSFFQRKASEVLTDEAALKLLAALYQDVVIEISEFDVCKNGISLAKLTAANFCEIGGDVIYITEAGQRFIDSIKDS